MAKKLLATFFIMAFLLGQAPIQICGMGILPCCCEPEEEAVKHELAIAKSEKSCCSSHREEEKPLQQENEEDPCKCEVKDHEPLNNDSEVISTKHNQLQVALSKRDANVVAPGSTHIKTVFTTGPPGPKQSLYILYQHLLL